MTDGYERIAKVVNGSITLGSVIVGWAGYPVAFWITALMGVGLIGTGLLNRCGTIAILKWWRQS